MANIPKRRILNSRLAQIGHSRPNTRKFILKEISSYDEDNACRCRWPICGPEVLSRAAGHLGGMKFSRVPFQALPSSLDRASVGDWVTREDDSVAVVPHQRHRGHEPRGKEQN
jgi:hypothetical protein